MSKWYNDPEKIENLRQWWAEGVSTIEIARRIGAPKNAIVSKAHRLGLERRASPIRTGGTDAPHVSGRQPQPWPAGKRSIPLLPSEEAALAGRE